MNHSRLQNLGVSFPYMVAPMVGISHVAFRELIRSYTPKNLSPLIFTEMLSTRKLPSQYLERAEILFTAKGERNLIPQLLGNEERFIAPSIEKLMPLSPWGFDINMGCPMNKTLAHNWGVRLMGDIKYASDVVRMTKKHSRLPVSVKLRAGADDAIDLKYLEEFTASLEDAGADWLTVHCRPRGQRHSGIARWDVVGEIAKNRKIPVVGNGDIQTADDAIEMLQTHKTDGAMIARAATARPWILWQIAHQLKMDTDTSNLPMNIPPLTPEEEGREYFKAVLRMSCLLEEFYGDNEDSMYRLLYFVVTSNRWLLFGHHFWKTLVPIKTLSHAREVINDYAEKNPQSLSRRVTL